MHQGLWNLLIGELLCLLLATVWLRTGIRYATLDPCEQATTSHSYLTQGTRLPLPDRTRRVAKAGWLRRSTATLAKRDQNVNESPTTPRRSRISESAHIPPLQPFVRATGISVASVYWLPVREFAIPFHQRQWLLHFFERLTAKFSTEDLLPETFLQLKYTRQELNQRFTQTLMEYEPVTGVLLAPGDTMPGTPTSLEIKKLVDHPDRNAEIGIQHLAPDYCVWFLQKNEKEQRRDFLGTGGILMLWVKSDADNAPPKVRISKALSSHPAFAAHDFDAQFRKLHSMQAPWLKQSKEVFGESIREEALYQGVPFILPKLDAAAFTSATPDQLAAWFGVFHAYCIESEKDKGLLLAVRDPDVDEPLQAILDEMRAEKLEYEL